MRSGTLSVSFWALAVTGAALGARVALVPLADVTPGSFSGAPPRDTASYAAPGIDSLVQAIVPRDPFRVTRRPASIAYDPIRAAQPPAPPPPKPALVLTGIVWDSRGNPSAVLDGLPSGGGPRVIRQGDQFGLLRVRRIARDRVVVAGMDTTWTLTVREPWK
jgi:hypothetical protein